jgi:S1-C subfamily serine protease
MDVLAADLARIAVYRYYAPSLSERQIGFEMRLPGGLYVLRARPPFAGPLERGDVILQVEGEPAVGPQVLQRALATARGEPLHLRVARGAARLEIEVPGSAGSRRP